MKPLPILSAASFGNLLEASEAQRASVERKGGLPTPYDAEIDDLYFLYSLVRESCAISALEFGSGWSTLALAVGLLENQMSFAEQYDARHPNAFQLMSVDADPEWHGLAVDRLDPGQRALVRTVHATPRLTTFGGRICSTFSSLPNFCPDVVYLDGPDPGQVKGEVGGYSSQAVHGLPMAADLLLIEPYLWPGTWVVTDGRTANARFLLSNFQRQWEALHDPYGDRTIMRLAEEPWGVVSGRHADQRLEFSRLLRKKQGAVQP